MPESGLMRPELHQIAALLKMARRILFITGAGVSAESGVPTFRGATAAFANGLTEEGIPFEDVLSGSTFQRDPKLCWKYFFRLEASIRGKQPNAAHRAMATLQDSGREIYIATQNIDGLHQSAGSNGVIELHGNLRRIICTGCDYHLYHETFEGLSELPRCPNCQSILRPDAVLYEEMLPEDALDRLKQVQDDELNMIFSVGTTSVFSYVTWPIAWASRRGITTVEINPEETPIFACRFFALARRIIIEAGPAICSIPSTGPHSPGFDSRWWRGLKAWKLSST